ncbi:MAG: VOC family protein [Planctomycetaceae bacterium]
MSDNQPLNNHGLSLLVIHAADLQQSVQFYRTLGLTFEEHDHLPCGRHYACTTGGCVFEICQRLESHQVGPVTFGFDVSNIGLVYQLAQQSGLQIKRKLESASWGRSFSVLDPDGNRVLLTEQSA